MAIVKRFEYVDERTLRGEDDQLYDVPAATSELGWVRQLCPFMPHEYAILAKGPEQAWFVVEAMIRLSPSSHRAYFRGYQTTNRYWDAPDGMRYWRSRFELDRWHSTDSEGLRWRKDEAKPIKDWDGPPWAPNGAGFYLQSANGKWWPSPRFFAAGYKPCKACLKPPPEIVERTLPADT